MDVTLPGTALRAQVDAAAVVSYMEGLYLHQQSRINCKLCKLHMGEPRQSSTTICLPESKTDF